MAAADATALGDQPPVAANFLLEVDGIAIGTFEKVQGLEVTVAVQEYAEGGVNGFVHRFPGQMSWPSLVFSRGLTKSDNLFEWMRKTAGDGFQGAGGKLERRTASVTLVDVGGTRLRSFSISDAFPIRWTGPALATADTSVLSEELEIAHHGFTSSTLA
ncbi:phage tail protein [Kineosporia sp. NBRC 101731]|uniref:phage tail protein n=1 Tax=Kineosporia sp. NBRC 101731 TaxID=3032199 RepID=UPI00255387D0|nr:phage tail protein [Kineosporia sp. NBRC 101731]